MPATEQNRIYFLDGLRGWAALSVLLYHVWVAGFPISPEIATILRRCILFNGNVAVYIFFITSGFALTVGYFQTSHTSILQKLLVGRYFRLVIPIGIASLIFYTALLLGLVPKPGVRPELFANLLHETPSWVNFLSFHLFKVLVDFDMNESIIFPLWTMQYEFIGSIGLMLSLLVFHRFNDKALLLLFSGVAISFVSKYYELFFIGALFAYFYVHGRKTSLWTRNARRVGIGSGIIAAVLSINLVQYGEVLPMLCAIAIFVTAMTTDSFAGFLSSPLSKGLGKISFPLYLIHGPVMWVVGLQLYGHMDQAIINSIVVLVSLLAGAVLLPVERFATSFSRRVGTMLVH